MAQRILLIEDDEVTRTGLVTILQNDGHRVTAYRSAEEVPALDCSFDVAFLDVRLPGEFGDRFAQRLRAACPHVRIVFSTAEADTAPLQVLIPDCFVLRKPMDVRVFLELLRGWETSPAG